MLRPTLAVLALTGLAACVTSPRMGDPRVQTLMAMPSPQHFAERTVASELAGACARYRYDELLAQTMSQERLKSRFPAYVEVRGAAELEADVKRRAMAARYGAASYGALDPCTVLDQETAQGTPLSVLVVRPI